MYAVYVYISMGENLGECLFCCHGAYMTGESIYAALKKNASYLHSNDFLTELKILRNYNKAKIKSYFSENIFIIFSDASHIGCN